MLREYLSAHEKEVVSIMMALFDQEKAVEQFGYEREQEGNLKRAMKTASKMFKAGEPIDKIAAFLEFPTETMLSWVGKVFLHCMIRKKLWDSLVWRYPVLLAAPLQARQTRRLFREPFSLFSGRWGLFALDFLRIAKIHPFFRNPTKSPSKTLSAKSSSFFSHLVFFS